MPGVEKARNENTHPGPELSNARESEQAQVSPGSPPSPQKSGLPNRLISWPMPWASESSRRLCGSFLNLIDRPILKSRPLPTRTKGMSSRVCEFPLPSSLVQTIRVLSSRLPPPPGSGVSASRFAR